MDVRLFTFALCLLIFFCGSAALRYLLRDHDLGGTIPFWAYVDAVYVQLGTLIQAERISGANYDLPDAEALSWGHAIRPGKVYTRP